MQTNNIKSIFSANSNLTLNKVKTQQQQDNFAELLNKVSSAKDKNSDSLAEDAKLREVCQELESVFLNMMLTQMRTTIPKSNLMGDNNNAQDIFQSLSDTEMSKEMAKAGGIGLADVLYRELAPEKNNITKSPSRWPVKQSAEQ